MLDTLRATISWTAIPLFFYALARKHPLNYLFLEVTRRCNLSCAYCGSDCTPAAQATEMPTERWIEVMRQVAADFDASKVMIAVTGGEPLLKPGILDLLQELNRLGFPYGMVTNGQHLDAAMARALVDAGLRSIALSLDGPPAVNDALRGPGTAAAVARAVKALQAAGYKGKLEVITTLTTPAIRALDDTRRHVAALRVPLWRVCPVMPIGRAAESPGLIPDAEEMRDVLHYVKRARKDGKRPPPEFGDEGYLGCTFEHNVRPYLFHCRAGITTGGILADGSMAACPELPRSFIQGHVDRDRFKTVWDRDYQVFRDRRWTKRGKCDGCDAYDRCQGGSLHLYSGPDQEISHCHYHEWNP